MLMEARFVSKEIRDVLKKEAKVYVLFPTKVFAAVVANRYAAFHYGILWELWREVELGFYFLGVHSDCITIAFFFQS